MENQDEDNLKPVTISEDINADVNDYSVNEEVNSVLDIDNDQFTELNETDTDTDSNEDDSDLDLEDDDLELAEFDDLDSDVDETDLRTLNGLDQDDKQTMS
jgi:hypothetical protein